MTILEDDEQLKVPADLDELQFFLWDQKAGTLDDLVLRMRKLDDAQLASAVQRGFITTALTSNKAKTLVAITAWMSTVAVTARYPTLRLQVRLLQEICDRDLGNGHPPIVYSKRTLDEARRKGHGVGGCAGARRERGKDQG